MSKIRSNLLFILIKSLSKSEKRYFRLSQSNAKDPKFLRLFEMINDQEVFDEDQILYKTDDFSTNQFSNIKAHLYSKILQSLRNYSLKSTPSIEIRELIDEAHILFNKSLYQQCARRLKKAEKLALDMDNLEMLLVIYKWQKRVLSHTLDWENQYHVDEIVEKVHKVNERINNINSFTNLQARLQSRYRKTGYIKDENEFKEIKKIFTNNMPFVNEKKLSITERIALYHLNIGYYFFIQDFREGMRYAEKWVAIFRNQNLLQKVSLESYISALNFLLIAQNKLGLLDKFQKTKKELRSLNKLHPTMYNENIRLKMLKYTFVHEFNSLFLSGEFDRGVELIERLSSGLEDFINQLNAHSRVILFYKTACLYFGNGNYSKSVWWLNKIFISKEVDLRADINGFARILNLICQYELGDNDLIQYSIRSTYRYLLKRDDLLTYPRLILSFLRGLKPTLSENQVIDKFRTLKERMLKIQDNPFERGFVYFDVVSWLEAKIEGKTIMEVIKHKVKNNIN